MGQQLQLFYPHVFPSPLSRFLMPLQLMKRFRQDHCLLPIPPESGEHRKMSEEQKMLENKLST